MRDAQIPTQSDGVGVWHEVHHRVQHDLEHIVSTLGTGHPKGSPEQLVADFYASFTDLPRLAAQGNAELVQLIGQFTDFSSPRALSAKLGELMRLQIDSVLNFSSVPDRYIPDRKLPRFSPGGLGLPSPEFYTESAYQPIRDQYQSHLERLVDLLGISDATGVATRSIHFETELAKLRIATLEDDHFHPTRVNRLQFQTRRIDWLPLLFELGIGIEKDPEIVLTHPDYLRGIDDLLTESWLEEWRSWITTRVLTGLADYASPPVAATQFAFTDQSLGGLASPRPRNVRVLDHIEFYLGDAIGQLYVSRHFTESADQAVHCIISNIITEYRETLRAVPWMTSTTRAAAIDKLNHLTIRVGHPRWWQDYSGLDIRPDDLLGNAIRASEHVTKTVLDRLNGNESGEDWQVMPHVVNAYYEESRNEIVLPAAFLQPPFFDQNADDAENYGAIGSIIAHEISHAFDDRGSKFDGYGRFRQWWTPTDREQFDLVRKSFVEKLSDLSSPEWPEIPINGDLTADEAISDLGGLTVAYRAWRRTKPLDSQLDDERSPTQRFFLSHAGIWRRKEVDAETSYRLVNDPHPPNELRCNFTLTQFAPFHAAFGVKPGDGMWVRPGERLFLW